MAAQLFQWTDMPILMAGDVHLWTARQSSAAQSVATLRRLLSPSEKGAASRFYFEGHRLSYIFAHGMLRHVLSNYVRHAPTQIRFELNSYGKPFLKASDPGHVQFNMSHSGDVVLIGVIRDRQIGVDVELTRPLRDFAAIAQKNFTPQEYALIKSHPAGAQHHAFFTSWTRKEAFIKAVGKGFAIPLNTFDTSIAPGNPGRWLKAPLEARDVHSWWLADLIVPPGYAGALAVGKGFDRLIYFNWNPCY
jgi:4'-phosphopantetheinyl transferase